MARLWSILVVMLACLVLVNTASAQEKKERKKGDRPSPEKRFDDLEKAVKHDPLTGVLTKEEFVKAVKATSSRMGDRAEEFFGKIKKADPGKVTKDEYVTAMKEMWKSHKRDGGKHEKKKESK